MDINSLLSPSESPRTTPAPSEQQPTKKGHKTRASTIAASSPKPPRPTSVPAPQPTTAAAHPATFQAQNVTQSSHAPSPTSRTQNSAGATPPTERIRPTRQPSTPGMDALADLATMQHHQQAARVNAGGLRNTEIYDNQASAANNLPTIPSLPGTQDPSILRGPSFDRSAIDPPTRPPSPRQLMASSLSESDQQKVTELSNEIATNSIAHEAHTQLINILHQGLINHVRVQTTSSKPGDPHSYELLKELRDARENMNSRFALGETLLADWIQDQILLSKTIEDRVAVMELCQKATEEERMSTKLWLIYAQWILSLYRNANTIEGPTSGGPGWSEEERALVREVFTWQQVMTVWQQGAQATGLRIDNSQLLWDPYIELMLEEQEKSFRPDGLQMIDTHFQNRLQTPHATWESTFQAYSNFTSKFDNANYEAKMAGQARAARTAKQKYEQRDMKEIALLRAGQQNDEAAELQAFLGYIDYEAGLNRKNHAFDFDLLNVLYQRALLKFPANTSLWEAYVIFLEEEGTKDARRKAYVLPVLEQATRHCPWSGNLWAQYLLSAEIAELSFAAIGEIKHKATSTGLLDAGSMEEILKVHTAWCGFLRRRAFQVGATDEERDVAEVGIRSAIEDMETAGLAKYGKGYQGDPDFKLEKIYMKYFTQCGTFEAVRETYKKLILRKGDSYDFWLRYYTWEMMVWGRLAFKENQGQDLKYLKPVQATKVLQQALKRPNMDWPEKIIETYRYHCEDHEDAETFQQSIIQVARTTRLVHQRREQEAYEAYEANQLKRAEALHQQAQSQEIDMVDATASAGKRKREDELDDGRAKRSREGAPEDTIEGDQSQHLEATSPGPMLKRDRENATVIVNNFHPRTSELEVRQFFRDCGQINGVKLYASANNDSTTATIEFESKGDAVAATTRDKKEVQGHVIDVQIACGTTLYVCNFPPTADEAWIREMFAPFGEIVDIRFPSLKYNTHRRFCYVQFKTEGEAHLATRLDGQEQEKGLPLVAKLSDPSQKQERHGAMYEGRELYLANVDWGVTEKNLKHAFSNYGYVESARIVKKINGQSRGFAFVVFRDKDSADAALEMNLTEFHGRMLNVSKSTNDTAKRHATQIRTSAPSSQRDSNSPAPVRRETANGSQSDDISNRKSPEQGSSITAEIQSRTLALMNIPDTVSDARIRALTERFGELVKVVLRPDHQGAIIEFKNVGCAGKAALGLEGYEINPGRHISTGTVAQLLKEKAEDRSDRQTTVPKKAQAFQGALPVRRPGQPGPRRGGKGGLGMKGAGVGLSRTQVLGEERINSPDNQESRSTNGTSTTTKSNADFREMLLKK